MKRLCAVIALVLLTAGAAFALSDAEYLRMRRNNRNFAQADKRLNQVWAQLKKSLPRRVFAELEEYQSEWIDSGRDIEAQAFIDDGYSKVEAYTMVTHDRADALPQLARDLQRKKTPSRPRAESPKPKPKPAAKPTPKRQPEPEPEEEPEEEPEPYNEPEPEPAPAAKGEESESTTESVADPSGEYESDNAFMTVKVIDRSSMELEVVISRWKDEVNWKATGWYDNGVLELSDAQYSTCQVTITFDPDRARVVPSSSDDWANATAEDFVIRGTYTKKQ